jgi:tripartite-type tricarboxylate transporter receptor subunit TctC
MSCSFLGLRSNQDRWLLLRRALLDGHVTAVSADYPTVVSQLQSGALRAVVTASPAQVEALPEVPTLADTGVSKYEAEFFYGIVAPAKRRRP